MITHPADLRRDPNRFDRFPSTGLGNATQEPQGSPLARQNEGGLTSDTPSTAPRVLLWIARRKTAYHVTPAVKRLRALASRLALRVTAGAPTCQRLSAGQSSSAPRSNTMRPIFTSLNYIFTLPKQLAPGKYLVHNNVRPTRHIGSRGFRCWLTDTPSDWTPCSCGFAPELGQHFTSVRPTPDSDRPPWE